MTKHIRVEKTEENHIEDQLGLMSHVDVMVDVGIVRPIELSGSKRSERELWLILRSWNET